MPTTPTANRFRTFWQKMPDRRSGTYYRRTAAGPPATYDAGTAVTNLWHRDLQTTPHPGNPGVYVVQTANLFMPKEPNTSFTTTNVQPIPGDQLQDAVATVAVPYTGIRWTLQSVSEVGALGCWAMSCVRPVIANAVAIAVQFQTPVTTISDSGQRVVTSWTTASSQSAWVQVQQTIADDVLGCRTFTRNATVYAPTWYEPTAQTTVLETVSSRRYTIVAVRMARELTELNEYELELIP